MRSVNGRLRRLESFSEERHGRSLSPATLRLFELVIDRVYNEVYPELTPAELEDLEAESRANDPDIWETLRRINYGHELR